jgi:hypothetical protein
MELFKLLLFIKNGFKIIINLKYKLSFFKLESKIYLILLNYKLELNF